MEALQETTRQAYWQQPVKAKGRVWGPLLYVCKCRTNRSDVLYNPLQYCRYTAGVIYCLNNCSDSVQVKVTQTCQSEDMQQV